MMATLALHSFLASSGYLTIGIMAAWPATALPSIRYPGDYCPAGVLGQLLVYAKAYSQPQYVTNIRGNYGIDHIDPHTLASETT